MRCTVHETGHVCGTNEETDTKQHDLIGHYTFQPSDGTICSLADITPYAVQHGLARLVHSQQHMQSTGALTSIHVAFFSAHSSMDLRRVTFCVRLMGLVMLWPVAGHLMLPCASQRSM